MFSDLVFKLLDYTGTQQNINCKIVGHPIKNEQLNFLNIYFTNECHTLPDRLDK